MKKIFQIICNKNHRMDCITLLLSLFYYLSIILGRQIMQYDYIPYNNISFWIKNIILIPLLFIALKLLLYYFSYSCKWFVVKTDLRDEMSDKKYFLTCLLKILAVWTIVWLSCFPGLSVYDGGSQLTQYLNGNISTHHPYLHTMFIAFCYNIGKITLHNTSSSFLVVYSILQSVIMALIFAYLLLELKRMKCRKLIRQFLLVWITFFPMNAIMALSTTKDTLFAGFFLLFMLQVVKIYQQKEKYLQSWKNTVTFFSVSFFLCCLRNNAPYVLLFSMPLIVLLLRKKWKKALIICVLLLCTYKVYDGPFLNSMNVTRGDSREALSMLIQPLCRVYNLKKDELSEGDIQNISTIIRGGQVFNYQSHISDPMKCVFDTDSFMDSKMKYIKTFIGLGFKYPDVYSDAFLAMTYGDWYPFEKLPDYNGGRFYYNFPESLAQAGSSSKIRPLAGFLNELIRYSSYLKIPFLCLLFASASCVWILFFLSFYMIYKKEYTKLFLTIPAWLLYITVLLGPVSLYRYVYPIIIIIPVLVVVTFQNTNVI